MNNYTVLLLKPDYVANQYGEETYLAHVRATSAARAQRFAQIEARDADDNSDIDDPDAVRGDSTGYRVLFTAMGHLQNLTEEQS